MPLKEFNFSLHYKDINIGSSKESRGAPVKFKCFEVL